MKNAQIPIQYLYRPEENKIRLSMDLHAPFSNAIRYGREGAVSPVDILETYLYFKGLPLHRRLRFDRGGKKYMVLKSHNRCVIFRDCLDGTDDTHVILDILKDERLAGITRLDINAVVNKALLFSAIKGLTHIHIITAEDFDSIKDM